MAGQLSHFVNYARGDHDYSLKRYANEYDRLLAVMDVRLRDREFLAGDLSIADFASFPWVLPYRRLGNDLDRVQVQITGASRTADVEKIVVVPAHGPKQLRLLLSRSRVYWRSVLAGLADLA